MKRFFIVSFVLAFLLLPCTAKQAPPPDGKLPLRILYAGMPGTARQKDFVSFLGKHFVAVKAVDVKTFTEAQAKDSDVVILDKDGIQWGSRGGDPLSSLKLPETYTRATLSLGIPGAFLLDRMSLKPGYR
ncbi:MAG: hypothetical protein GY809_31485 [Planctomycetes bacterium]|nr:hypothetical protein [Planctomycetota bacterium]